MTKSRICPGCDRRVVYVQRHHWPHRVGIPDGEVLEHVIYLCSRCNNILGQLFPRMNDVPWEAQRSALDEYYHEQHMLMRALREPSGVSTGRRRAEIARMLGEGSEFSVNSLAIHYGVSASTIRNDVCALREAANQVI